MTIYSHMDDRGRVVTLRDAETSVIAPRPDGGVYVRAGGGTGVHIPDDEIPALVSALQNYMSKRAQEITRAARGPHPKDDAELWEPSNGR